MFVSKIQILASHLFKQEPKEISDVQHITIYSHKHIKLTKIIVP